MLPSILTILAIILTIILVIGVHELGHALMARIFRVKIQNISIGFGKSFLTWHAKSGTIWSIRLLPLGGYVKLLDSSEVALAATEKPYCFDQQIPWVRCSILLAGPLANFILALGALIIVFMLGYPQQAPLIHTVRPASIAAQANLKAGDRIISLASHQVYDWQDVNVYFLTLLGKNNIPITVSNDQGRMQTTSIDLTAPRLEKKRHASLLKWLGVEPEVAPFAKETIQGLPGNSVFAAALSKFTQLIGFSLVLIKQLCTGMVPFAWLLGPISLANVAAVLLTHNISIFLYFIANLSIAIAVVNLLPLPTLDGGMILYTLIEKIRGKPISIAMQILLYRLSMVAFFLLLVQLILNDLLLPKI